MPTVAHVVALTLACHACGDTVRIDARTSDGTVAEDGSAWMVTHHDPEMVAVEVESAGVVDEWVAT